MDILTGSYIKVVSNGVTYKAWGKGDHEVILTLWYKDNHTQYFGILCVHMLILNSNFSLNIFLCVLSQTAPNYIHVILKTE